MSIQELINTNWSLTSILTAATEFYAKNIPQVSLLSASTGSVMTSTHELLL